MREHGREILLLSPVWTLSSSFGAWCGDSLTRHQAPKDDERCPAWGELKNLPTTLSMMPREHGEEILLLATIRQTTMTDVQPGASKRISPPCSLIIIESNVGRFSYSSEAGHLSSSFSAWWRVRESPHHAPNDDERVQTGESKRISPPLAER